MIGAVLSVSLLLLALVAAPTALAVDARTSIPEGMCSLWTARQAGNAMGERMEVVRDDPDYCVWYSKNDHNGSISTLSAGLWGGDPSSELPLLDQARDSGSRWTKEEVVAGVPVLMTDVHRSGKLREITAAAFPDPTTWLNLNATSVIGKDVRRAVRRMVELTAPSFAANAGPSGGVPAPSDPLPSADPCALLTADEVAAALGEPVTANQMPPVCLYTGDIASGSQTSLTLGLLTGEEAASGAAQAQGLGWTELTIADLPALQAPPEEPTGGRARSTLIVMMNEATVLVLSADVPETLDAAAAVRTLAELAVPRISALPTPSTAPASAAPSMPLPSGAARTGLAALFPAEIGGAALEVETLTGRQFLDRFVGFKPMEDRVIKGLQRRDRRLRDLTFAQAESDHGSLILAFQVDGGRIGQHQGVLLEALSMDRIDQQVRPEDVAGKEGVFAILSGSQGLAYPNGEVLWLVFSFGDEQVEIFSKLP
jgi:hypothetical protein